MQRRIYCTLLLLLIKSVSFSQMESTMMAQFDIVSSSLTMKSGEFIMGVFDNSRMFIVKRVKDSLCVAKYLSDSTYLIAGVCSVTVNDDSLFLKTVDSLFIDIQKKHNYRPYSKEHLNSDNFYLVFPKKGKLQLFTRKDASPAQQAKANFIHRKLNVWAVVPNKSTNSRMKSLNIKTWNDLLNYLKSGAVDNVQPKHQPQ